MPNILLTTRCNLHCKYCFAQEKLASSKVNMPLENVQRVIDFLKRSEFPIFRVMGGEPTLHPQFNEIIQVALAAGMRVDVLSNATWTESTAELFGRIPSSSLMFLLNIDHPDNYTPKIWSIIQRNLAGLEGRGGITLSFNIFEKQPRSEYVLEIARRYDIKYIRLSLSLPVLGAGNAHLAFSELHEVAPFVMRFAAQAEAQGVQVQFDNAVPLCIFDNAQTGVLLSHGIYDLHRNMRCDPIIDIGPDLTIWSCFCLSALKNRKLDEFATLADAQDYYRQVWSVYQGVVYPLEQCNACYYREKWGCQGGCLTYAMMQDGGARYASIQPEPTGAALDLERVLCLAEDVRVFHYDLPRPSILFRKTSANLDFAIDDSFAPVMPLLEGGHTLDEILAALPAPNGGSQPLQAFLKDMLAETVPDLLGVLLQQGFLEQRSRR